MSSCNVDRDKGVHDCRVEGAELDPGVLSRRGEGGWVSLNSSLQRPQELMGRLDFWGLWKESNQLLEQRDICLDKGNAH